MNAELEIERLQAENVRLREGLEDAREYIEEMAAAIGLGPAEREALAKIRKAMAPPTVPASLARRLMYER